MHVAGREGTLAIQPTGFTFHSTVAVHTNFKITVFLERGLCVGVSLRAGLPHVIDLRLLTRPQWSVVLDSNAPYGL